MTDYYESRYTMADVWTVDDGVVSKRRARQIGRDWACLGPGGWVVYPHTFFTEAKAVEHAKAPVCSDGDEVKKLLRKYGSSDRAWEAADESAWAVLQGAGY